MKTIVTGKPESPPATDERWSVWYEDGDEEVQEKSGIRSLCRAVKFAHAYVAKNPEAVLRIYRGSAELATITIRRVSDAHTDTDTDVHADADADVHADAERYSGTRDNLAREYRERAERALKSIGVVSNEKWFAKAMKKEAKRLDSWAAYFESWM